MTRRSLLLAGLIGILVLTITWVAVLPDDITPFEEWGFRAFNDLPDWIEYPGWPVMQLGAIVAVPIVAVVCIALFRDWRVPARIAVAGATAWVIAKVAKDLVDRGRPNAFLADVNLRPAWEGLGFPSGHAAVAFAIAVILTSTLDRRWRTVVWGVAVGGGLLRIYTSAHFPLDVLGGWGLGLAVGSIVEIGWRRLAERAAEQQDEGVLVA